MVSSMFFVAVASPNSVAYAAGKDCKESGYFGIPAWYRNVVDSNCNIKVGQGDNAAGVFIGKVVMNLIQGGLVIVSYVAIGFIIKAGFMYMTSIGSPDVMQNAKKTLTNALIGLVIAALSAAIVNAIAGIIK